ncbi:MAG: lysophospholipid acyltransferase family protein [Woeseiaceae bacterium]
MLLIRSLLFQLYFFVSVLAHALLIALCRPLPFRVRYAMARNWAKSMLWAGRFLCGIDYVVEGLEFIPDEPGVIMLKHSTVFETYAQLAFLPTQSWVLKRELKWIPIFGWGLATLKPIAINRGAGHSAVHQVIEQGKARLAEGIWVSIFPEGTRMAPGTTRRYGVSGAALALETGCQILPVAHNAGDLWPRRSLIKRPGVIRFCIGPPIDAGNRTPKETNLLVQTWIENKMSEISEGRAPQR